MSILATALAWHDAGYAVLPTRSDGSKAPLGEWKAYTQHRPTTEQIHEWFDNEHPGMGLVCGAVSGGLEMLELEGRAVKAGKMADLRELAVAANLGALVDRVSVTGYMERTPTGGVHLLYRVAGPVAGNTKLARDAGGLVLAETRGEGGYVVIAPSSGSTHPTGLPWVVVVGDTGSVPTLDPDEVAALHTLMRCLDETPPGRDTVPPVPAEAPRPRSGRPGGLAGPPGPGGLPPGEDYEARTAWKEILEPYGWTFVYTHAGVDYWRRPGKRAGISATTGHAADRDRLFVFSSSTDFDHERSYTKFGAYAVLAHRGDHAAAATALHGLGFGRVALAAPSMGILTRSPPSLDESSVDPVDTLQALLLTSKSLDDIPDPEWLIENVLVKNSPGWLQGKPGHGKSFLALDWAGCVGAGIEWWNRPVKQGLVLYLVAEGATGIKLRVRAWEGKRERSMDNVLFLPVAIQVASPGWATLIALVARLQPAMVVIDTQARVTVGMEENAAKDMGEFVAAVELLREASQAMVLLVHHEGRAGEHMRGSTALEGAAVTIVRVVKDEQNVTVTNPKQKDAAEFEPVELVLEPAGSSAFLSPMGQVAGSSTVDSLETVRLWRQWWDTFGTDLVSPKEALITIGMPRSAFYRARGALVKSMLLRNDGTEKRPMYRLLRGPVDIDSPK